MQDMQKQMHALQQEIAAMKRSDYSQDSEVEAEHSVTRGRSSGTPIRLRRSPRQTDTSRSPRKPAASRPPPRDHS
eukprot:2297634-Karenia_brevis.AAC.1